MASLDMPYQHQVLQVARQVAREQAIVGAILPEVNLALALAYADRPVLPGNGQIARILEQPAALMSEVLREVFNVDLWVTTNPLTGQPLVVYIGPGVWTR